MAGTTIPTLSPAQFASRMAALFPRGWAGDDAKQTGNVYSLLLSIGTELAVLQNEVQYALAAQRLQTETSPELNYASADFLGDLLPRPSGLTDAAYAEEIIAALFQPAATRPALQQALYDLTGVLPRLMEPWNPSDTGALGYGGPSFWNVDTVQHPFRWGNGGLRYQGFIETTPPSISALGPNNPILTWGTFYWNVPGYFFGIIQPASENSLNNTLNRLRAYGTIVWVRLLSQSALTSITGVVAPGPVQDVHVTATGTGSITLAWTIPTTGTPPYTYQVLYQQFGATSFIAGPTITTNTYAVTGLTSGINYNFEVVIRNAAGASTSAPITAGTGLIAPSPALNLTATLVQSTAVTLSWTAPLVGTPPFTYSVNYRVTGTQDWDTLTVGQGALTVTVISLQPLTEYDFEVITTNV